VRWVGGREGGRAGGRVSHAASQSFIAGRERGKEEGPDTYKTYLISRAAIRMIINNQDPLLNACAGITTMVPRGPGRGGREGREGGREGRTASYIPHQSC